MQIFAENVFENPIEIIEAFDNESFFAAFKKLEILRKRPDTYLLGYIRYEAKDIFLGKRIKLDLPLLYFEVYQESKQNQCTEATRPSTLRPFDLSTINYATYKSAINKIKKQIALGNTYEVNYTYDWEVKTNLDGFELYQNILPRQKTSYNAYIKNKYEEILSFSPELFFELEENKIKTKPMKGTIKKGENESEDLKNIEFLKNDIKNRAENVMIVDLLRNDLGKIAKTGTVKVDKLFEIETHQTLHQMTSEISAELEENTTLLDIFNAIFPCGSITGAPKISTMQIIDSIEQGSRGVYCGAIGLITPQKTIFSVPIRILRKTAEQKSFFYRVGGAIVWDSTPEDEWEETKTKIKFLQPDLKIVETILVKDGKLPFEQEHLQRMRNSAKNLGFDFTDAKMHRCIDAKFDNDKIIRLILDKNGNFEMQNLPLNEIKTKIVSISKTPVNSQEPLLYHKTTHRPWYDDAMKKIKNGEIFDEIFFNEKNKLTEGARSNIILQIEGKWYTPPVKCGLLDGILRQQLLKEQKLIEKILYLEDLQTAEKIFCINSVRGIVEVKLKNDTH